MPRIKTFSQTPGGGILPTDLNSIQDAYEPFYSAWRPVFRRWATVDQNAGNGAAYVLTKGSARDLASGGIPPHAAFPWDSSNYAAGSRTIKWRLKLTVSQNATASSAVRARLAAVSGTSTPSVGASSQLDLVGGLNASVSALADFAQVSPTANTITSAVGGEVAATVGVQQVVM